MTIDVFFLPILSETRPTGTSDKEQTIVSTERIATAVAKEPVIW